MTLIEQAVSEGVITEHQARVHHESLVGMVYVCAVGASEEALDSFNALSAFLRWLDTQRIDGHTVQ